MAKIPWRTPFTYGEGGEIRLEPMAKEWFQNEVQKREGLVEEMRAEAGESRFVVKQTLRGKWFLAQGSAIKKMDGSGDVSFRCAPTDGLVEKGSLRRVPAWRFGSPWYRKDRWAR